MKRLCLCLIIICVCGVTRQTTAGSTDLPPEIVKLGPRFFPGAVRFVPVDGLEDDEQAFEARGVDGALLGWLFCTDRMPPVHKGKRGEIGVLVGIKPDAALRGVWVIRSRETRKYFARIKADFYRQFPGRAVRASYRDVDTVTRATKSSRAMVRDVFESARQLLRKPAVKQALND